MPLTHADNAPRIFFDQAARPDLTDRPRCMVPAPDGSFLPLTWGELAARTERLAAFLVERGVQTEVSVAVLANTRPEWGEAGLALLAAGGTLVPVYPSLTPELLAHILGHSDAGVLVVENAALLRGVLSVWDRVALDTVVVIDPAGAAGAAAEAGVPPGVVVSLADARARGAELLAADPGMVQRSIDGIELDHLGYLIYTSGTTGLPKGVRLSHRNVGVNGADWIALNGPLLHEGDVDVLWLPMSHVFGWGEFCLGNQLGLLTYFSDPLHALSHLQEVRAHVFMSVPAYWEKLARAAEAAAPDRAGQVAALREVTGGRLSFALSGGAGLRREVKDLFLAAGMLLIEGYGLTECSPTLTMNRVDDYDFDTVGKPLPSVQLKLAPDGEILAKGDNVFLGYHKDPEATAAMFDAQGWLRTGDLGTLTERGFLKIVGRKKEILVTAGGKNIPPENIEIKFRDDPLIACLVVYGDGKRYLTALVDIDEAEARRRLAAEGETMEDAAGPLREHPRVRAWIRQRVDAVNATLARFETIKAFAVAPEPLTMAAGFLTPSLKVKRARVYEAFADQLEALYR